MLPVILKVKAFLDAYVPHWVILVLFSSLGAVFEFFRAEPDAQLLLALTHWSVAWPMVRGAAAVFALTAIALLKKAPWTALLLGGSASGGGSVTGGVVTVDSRDIKTVPPKPPSAKRSRLTLAVGPLLLAGCSLLASSLPIFGKVEKVILNDLAAGDTTDQIEQDVGYMLGGKVGVDVVAIVQETITTLIDAGEIPPNLLEAAKALQSDERAKLAARAMHSAIDRSSDQVQAARLVTDAVTQ